MERFDTSPEVSCGFTTAGSLFYPSPMEIRAVFCKAAGGLGVVKGHTQLLD